MPGKRDLKDKNVSLSVSSNLVLYSISIICGAILMALEIAGGRLLSPFFGSSVYVWGSVISVFLIALSTGYYYGGVLADRKPILATLAGLIAISGVFIFAIPYMLPPLVHLVYGINLYGLEALLAAMILFFLPSVGLGMVSPYIVKLGVREAKNVGEQVGKFYSVSTFGSILGTLGTTFILIPLFGVKSMIFAMGIILVLLALIIYLYKRLFKNTALLSLVLMICLGISLYYNPPMALSAERGRTLYEKETLYNNLAVVDGWDNLRYLLFNETEQSAMSQAAPEQHIWPYTYLMTAITEFYKPDSSKELLIGLGGGTIPKYTYAYRPKVEMDAVEIDPEVVKVAKEFFFLDDNERIHTFVDDGRMFLQDKDNVYDAIMVDAYNRHSIPYHLTTIEFFRELSNALKPDGIVVFNVISGVEGDNGKFLKSLLKTSAQVFKYRKIFFAEHRISLEDTNNLILVVSNSELKGDQVEKFQAYGGNIDYSSAVVLTDDYAPVENLAASLMMR